MASGTEQAEHGGLVEQVFFFFPVRCSSLTLPLVPNPNFIFFFIFVCVYFLPPLIMLGFIDVLEFGS